MKEIPIFNTTFDFKWVAWSKQIRFEFLGQNNIQLVNHFEFHNEISTKDLLFKNMLEYCEHNKLNVYKFVPLTFIIDSDKLDIGSEYDCFSKCFHLIPTVSNIIRL